MAEYVDAERIYIFHCPLCGEYNEVNSTGVQPCDRCGQEIMVGCEL